MGNSVLREVRESEHFEIQQLAATGCRATDGQTEWKGNNRSQADREQRF